MAPAIHGALFACATILFLPGALFGLAGGLLFGPVLGTVLILAGATLGTAAAFIIARYIAGECPAGRRTVATVATAAQGPGTVSPTPGPRKPPRFPETGTRKPSATVLQLPFKGQRKPLSKAETLAFVQAEITQRGSIPSQDAIAARCGRRKGTVSRWLRDWERSGLVSRQQEGRCKVVASA